MAPSSIIGELLACVKIREEMKRILEENIRLCEALAEQATQIAQLETANRTLSAENRRKTNTITELTDEKKTQKSRINTLEADLIKLTIGCHQAIKRN